MVTRSFFRDRAPSPKLGEGWGEVLLFNCRHADLRLTAQCDEKTSANVNADIFFIQIPFLICVYKNNNIMYIYNNVIFLFVKIVFNIVK